MELQVITGLYAVPLGIPVIAELVLEPLERGLFEVVAVKIMVLEDTIGVPQVPGAEKRAQYDVQYSDVVPHHTY